MSKYDINNGYDLESQKDVTLTSYNRSLVDDLGSYKGNISDKGIKSNGNDFDGRLTASDVTLEKSGAIQPNNGHCESPFFPIKFFFFHIFYLKTTNLKLKVT